MSDPVLDVVELLLTARAFTADESLDANDLPPRHRQVFLSPPETDTDDDDAGTRYGRTPAAMAAEPATSWVERPLSVTEETARKATDADRPWDAISDLMFTDRDEFSGSLSITEPEMAEKWYLKRADADRLLANPTIAATLGDRGSTPDEVTHEAARERNRPLRADRAWIDGLLAEYFDDDDEEDAEMLDLVEIRAPEEVEVTLDDLVLTPDQHEEIGKIGTAIEHRDYLASIGLREIGKLLFVGPPGTGKTSTARALARDLDLPIVEVKLSMITSQYLGETAKNVDKTFEVAKRLSPCILFIDEFDFVAKTRRSDEHAALKRAVNTLLKSIDEVSLVRDEVLLIGATNHPDQLDAAAWRRFDEIVNFPRPDRSMRAAIIELVTRDMEVDDLDAGEIAEATEGLTGSDLRVVLREAVLNALTEGRWTPSRTRPSPTPAGTSPEPRPTAEPETTITITITTTITPNDGGHAPRDRRHHRDAGGRL
ncbi:AAA family ATPase [Halobacteriales archaeon SW_7_68_16]|nr:MAG: AAA family ATPase [Halobacteriales archaeon SW_7_68_16]